MVIRSLSIKKQSRLHQISSPFYNARNTDEKCEIIRLLCGEFYADPVTNRSCFRTKENVPLPNAVNAANVQRNSASGSLEIELTFLSIVISLFGKTSLIGQSF